MEIKPKTEENEIHLIQFKPTKEFFERLPVGDLIEKVQREINGVVSCDIGSLPLSTGEFSCSVYGWFNLDELNKVANSAGYQVN